jgi:hypothetical protein
VNSPKTLRAYLSGGMEFAKGEGSDWRREMDDWIRLNLKHTVFNPNVESDRFLSKKFSNARFRELKHTDISLYTSLVRELIDIDIQEIAQHSDYVVCYWDESAQLGAGTKGELTIARFTHKPVYMVTAMKHYDIPGWVLGCATSLFGSFSELKTFLAERYSGELDET